MPDRRISWAVGACAAVLCLNGPLSQAASAYFVQETATSALAVGTAILTAPGGLTATAGCVTLVYKVDLAWTVVDIADRYRIYRKRSSDPSFVLLGEVLGGSSSQFTDSTVAAATTYDYVVDAVRGGWTARSAVAPVTSRSLCLLF